MGWEEYFSQHYLEHGFELISEFPRHDVLPIQRKPKRRRGRKTSPERMEKSIIQWEN